MPARARRPSLPARARTQCSRPPRLLELLLVGLVLAASVSIGPLSAAPAHPAAAAGNRGNAAVWGTELGWGANYWGMLGNASGQQNSPVTVSPSSERGGCAGYSVNYLITPTGSLMAAGQNSYGELGNGSNDASPNTYATFATVPGISGATACATGSYHTLVIAAGGQLFTWGNNTDGEVGNSSTATPVDIPYNTGITNAVAVAGSSYGSGVARSDGSLWFSGYDGYGEFGMSGTFTSFTRSTGFSGHYTALAMGQYFTMALRDDGTIWTAGYNTDGELGNGTTTASSSPVEVQTSSGVALTGVVAVAAMDKAGVALTSAGTVYTWGYNTDGELGNGGTAVSKFAKQADSTHLTSIHQISAGGQTGYAVKSDGTVWCWGWNGDGELGNGSADTTAHTSATQVSGVANAAAVQGAPHGYYGTVITDAGGTVSSWGDNTSGVLGNNRTSGAMTPTTVLGSSGTGSLSGVTALASSDTEVLANLSDGSVWAWGSDAFGDLGNNSTTDSHVPVQVLGAGGTGTLGSIVAVAAGSGFGLALRADGTVWSWGYNSNGQLGNNTTTDSHVPVQVLGAGGAGTLSSVVAISAGNYWSMALKSDGTVWTWGANSAGQLGINSTLDSHTPAQVKGVGGSGTLASITAIAASTDHALALKSDGSVCSWGNNSSGQLGNNTTTQSNAPVQVIGPGGTGTLTGVAQLATGTGLDISVVLKSDGTVWTWGADGDGKLGNNGGAQSNVPVEVVGSGGTGVLSGVAAVASGYQFELAMLADGSVWGWGDGSGGQLADGSIAQQHTPVRAEGISGSGWLAGAVGLAAGGNDSFAVTPPPAATVTSLSPTSGSTAGGTSVVITGTGFTGATAVTFGGVAATAFTVNSSTQITATSPVGGAGAVDVVVSVAGGASPAGPADAFTYIALPVVTLVSAPRGPTTGGQFVMIGGSGLTGATAVKFGATAATSFTVQSDSLIAATAPAGSAGAVDVTVTTGGGTSAAGNPDRYSYYAPGSVNASGWGGWGSLGTNTTNSSTIGAQTLNSAGTGDLTGITSTVAGWYASYGLDSAGHVWAWGYNSNGQLGDNGTGNSLVPVEVMAGADSSCGAYLCNIVMVAAGAGPAFALDSSGRVWAWGYNAYNDLGINNSTTELTPVQVLAGADSSCGTYLCNIRSISADWNHSLAVDASGHVWTWGESNATPVEVGAGADSACGTYLCNAVSTDVTQQSDIVLDAAGHLWAWGDNSYGQLGVNSTTNAASPVEVLAGADGGCATYLCNITSIGAGNGHVLALDQSGRVWAWGENDNGEVGNNSTVNALTPVEVLAGADSGCGTYICNAVAIARGPYASMVADAGGHAWGWGYNTYGGLGNNTSSEQNTAVAFLGTDGAPLGGVQEVSPGDYHSLVLVSPVVTLVSPQRGPTTGGQFVMIAGIGLTGATAVKFGGTAAPAFTVQSDSLVSATVPAGSAGAVDITVTTAGGSSGTSSSDRYTYTAPGAVDTWGVNGVGQLGNNSTAEEHLPVQVTGPGGSGLLSGVIATSIGSYHGLALKSDGTVWAWGQNNDGQLGNNSTTNSSAPVEVLAGACAGCGTYLSGVVAIAAGSFHSVALRSDGTVWTWGDNQYGELGNNSTTQANTPVEVLTGASGCATHLCNIVAVSADEQTVALRADGSVFAWGSNNNGQVGNNSITNQLAPVQVLGAGGSGTLGGIVAISRAGQSSMALRSDGTVWAWGEDNHGQLGNNGTADSHVPVEVVGAGGSGALTGVIAISGFWLHSMALRSDGTVWTWGDNLTGQLGNNSSTDSQVPVQVLGAGGSGVLTGVVAIAAGDQHSMAITADGNAWLWGWNAYGQLGINSNTGPASCGTYVCAPTPVQVWGAGGIGNLSGVIAIAGGWRFSAAEVPVPAVASISPTTGPTSGGTGVTLTGSGFTGARSVTFGSTAASTFTVNSDTSITVTSPPEAAATVDVVVSTTDGSSATGAADRFTFTATPATLTINAPGAVSLGSGLAPGTTLTGVALGALNWTNTLSDGQSWSVTVASTDLRNAASGATLPFTDMSIGVGQSFTLGGSNSGGNPTPGSPGPTTLTGSDPTPGTSYSNPLTLATGTSAQQGSYTQSGSTITVAIPASLANSGPMSGTVQYTIVG